MENTMSFVFEDQPIRTVYFPDDLSVWFVGKDVCNVLGYKDTVNALKQHCRGVVKHHPIVDSLGRNQEARIINLPDTLRLIANSTLPAAQRIEAWMFEEVIPTVLKTGTYTIPGREWKSPPISRIKEFRLACDKGYMTVNEYRRLSANLPPFEIDAPQERPGKGVMKRYPLLEEPAYKSEGLIKFVDDNLEITGNPNDFIRLADLYERYIREAENPLTRWSFIHMLKGSFNLLSRQKKLNGYPTLVFIGCKFKMGENGV